MLGFLQYIYIYCNIAYGLHVYNKKYDNDNNDIVRNWKHIFPDSYKET